jgi:integrase
MGNIKKLKSGKYAVDVYDVNGVRHRPHFNLLKHANMYVNLIDQEKYNYRLYKAGLEKKPMSFREAIPEFIKTKEELRASTFKKYENIFNNCTGFINSLGITNINEFRRDHADLFRDELVKSEAAPKTINHYLQAIKAFFREQVNRDRLQKSPMDHVKSVREKSKTLIEKEEEYYSEEEIKNFFSQEMEKYLQDVFIGLFLTGCRIAEFASLTWSKSIDWDNRLIKIRTDANFEGKTPSAERDIPMTDELYNLLSEKKRTSGSEYVFNSAKGKQLRERRLLEKCKDIAKEAGIGKNATLHKWRHTFSSFLLRVGFEHSERQYLMGHKSQNVTDHYTKIDPTKLHDKITKLDNYVFPTINNKAISN